MFTAFTAVFGLLPPIPIPFIPVPITLQTFGVMLTGALLGSKKGFLSILLLVALIAIGIPLLSGGRGGLGVLTAPGGGYILSWPLAAFMIGWFTERLNHYSMRNLIFINVVGGILFIYLCGSLWFSFTTDLPFPQSFIANLAFLPGDAVKVVLTAALTIKLKQTGTVPILNETMKR